MGRTSVIDCEGKIILALPERFEHCRCTTRVLLRAVSHLSRTLDRSNYSLVYRVVRVGILLGTRRSEVTLVVCRREPRQAAAKGPALEDGTGY